MYPKGCTNPSSGDAAQASARLAHDISRGILQPVITSINALVVVMVMVISPCLIPQDDEPINVN
jgi:hypothetical protein